MPRRIRTPPRLKNDAEILADEERELLAFGLQRILDTFPSEQVKDFQTDLTYWKMQFGRRELPNRP